MNDPLVAEALQRVAGLEVELREVLGTHESAPERVIYLEQSYDALAKLSLDQDELFREALRAVELGLFRAAHVLAWAGFVDFLHNYVWDNFEKEVGAKRAKWSIASADDFRDYTDFAVIETGEAVGAYGKTLMKALHGLLNTRNECAHPSDYFPDLNEALGYLSGLFQRIGRLQKKVSA